MLASKVDRSRFGPILGTLFDEADMPSVKRHFQEEVGIALGFFNREAGFRKIQEKQAKEP